MSEVFEIGRIVPLEQIYAGKDETCTMFGYDNHKSTFRRLWMEFKNHDDFKIFYRAPTYGVPIVNIAKFDEFLTWKDRNKFRGDKK